MNPRREFEKWWDSTNNANYFKYGAPAHMVKQVALEAFLAATPFPQPVCGPSILEGKNVDREKGVESYLTPCDACGRTTLNAECGKHVVPGVTAPKNSPLQLDEQGHIILRDEDIYAVANRIKPWIKNWLLTLPKSEPSRPDIDPKTPKLIRFTNAAGTFEKCFNPSRGWYWVRVDVAPKPVILDTQVLRADTRGCVVLSDEDVDRIAKATVAHGYALRAEATRQKLGQQLLQMQEQARMRQRMQEPGTALRMLKRKAAQARVDVAIRDSEAAISNALGVSSTGFIISALKNLVAAVKILKEQVHVRDCEVDSKS